jgi:hypothetical protein
MKLRSTFTFLVLAGVPAALGAAETRPTAAFRQEHAEVKVIGLWIDELATLAAAPDLDARAFARKTDRLLGLIAAHF